MRDRYRQIFSAVFSDTFLFDRLIREDLQAAPERTEALLDELGLRRRIDLAGTGDISTQSLSTGQRKRLALMLALLDDRPVFVLDEWAADQDPTFKALFYRQILPELRRRGKAIFAITHDDRYFQGDRVLTMDNGKIVAVSETPAVSE